MEKKSQSMGSDSEVVQMTKSIVKNIKVTMVNVLRVFKKMEASNNMLKKRMGNSCRVIPNNKKGLTMSGMKTMH